MKQFILIGQTPVPEPDLLTWARWFEESDRRVMLTRVLDTAEVSTVFLGIDHSWGRGEPILFESMVFWPDRDAYEERRCSTWAEAERMHASMVREAASPRAWLRYFGRCLGAALSAACRDWHELRLQVSRN